jgi:two-component system sensor histidine kinase BaeS
VRLGLRARLLAALALVLLGVLAALGLFTRATVRRELDHFLVRQGDLATARAVARIEAHHRAHGSWDGVAPLLARVLAEERLRTLIVDARGAVLARHPEELGTWTVTPRPEGGVALSRRSAGSDQQLVLRGPLARTPGGDVYLLPLREPEPGGGLPRAVDRWLLSGLAAALVAALALAASVVRRVLAPVGELTVGARALAAGRPGVRVPAVRRDELGELARSFNAMAEALERNEAVRRDLVSDVAHELRTPLAAVRASIEAAQDGLVAADAALLASLHEEVLGLARLVDDLQQLSLAQAGALRVEAGDVALAEAAARAVDAVRPEAARRGLALRLEVPAGLAARADPDRLLQVVRNLVANALVHARAEIVVAAAARDGRVELRVADDGPGVPPEAAPRVFDRFFRADASRSRATGGSGLGLAIARQLAGLMGGTLALENRPGAGATFVLTLPSA